MSKKRERGELWQTVKEDIELRILNGEYQAGDKIPTIVELMAIYGICRGTAHKVTELLSKEGIIVKRVAFGCFVQPDVKDKILARHKKQLQDDADILIDYSQSLGISEEQLMQMVATALMKHNKKEK